MEHRLNCTFHIKKNHVAHLAICYNLPLVCYQPLRGWGGVHLGDSSIVVICEIWPTGLLSTIVSRQVLIGSVFGLIYSLEFKMTQNPKHGVKSDPGLTPLIFGAGPTKRPPQYYKLALPVEKHHHPTYIFALLIEERFIFIWFYPLKYNVLHHKNPIRDSQRQGALIIGAFPAHAAWLGLTATIYNKWFS